jgi:tRNA(His) guanylyltransferase
MNFDDFDAQMRVYETTNDRCILPGLYIVVRLDGRGFTKITASLTKPFDENFDNKMTEVTRCLMEFSGFKVIYGYHQSDEISLLFAKDEDTFGRKERKILTTLASGATAWFNGHSGPMKLLPVHKPGTFDARICELPSKELVLDYFRWRQEDAARNALSSWAYWTLRKKGDGMSATAASSLLLHKGHQVKHDLLMSHGINFAELPDWQKNGTAVWWDGYQKEGIDPRDGTKRMVARRRLVSCPMIKDPLSLKYALENP